MQEERTLSELNFISKQASLFDNDKEIEDEKYLATSRVVLVQKWKHASKKHLLLLPHIGHLLSATGVMQRQSKAA